MNSIIINKIFGENKQFEIIQMRLDVIKAIAPISSNLQDFFKAYKETTCLIGFPVDDRDISEKEFRERIKKQYPNEY